MTLMYTKRLIANIGQLILLANTDRRTVATGALILNSDGCLVPVNVAQDGIIEILGPKPGTLPKGESHLDYTLCTELTNSVCVLPGWKGLDPERQVFQITLPRGGSGKLTLIGS